MKPYVTGRCRASWVVEAGLLDEAKHAETHPDPPGQAPVDVPGWLMADYFRRNRRRSAQAAKNPTLAIRSSTRAWWNP